MSVGYIKELFLIQNNPTSSKESLVSQTNHRGSLSAAKEPSFLRVYFYMVTFQIRTFGRNICNWFLWILCTFNAFYYITKLLDIAPQNTNYTSQSSL